MVEYEGEGTIGFDYTLNLTETIVMLDSPFKDLTRTLPEEITLNESRPKMDYATTKEELIILRDGDSKDMNKLCHETITLAEARTHAITTSKIEAIVLLDVVNKGTAKDAFTESILFTDTLLRGTNKLLTETLTLTTAFTGTVYLSVARAPAFFVSTGVPSLYTSKTSVPNMTADR